jgi:hypothetical protein
LQVFVASFSLTFVKLAEDSAKRDPVRERELKTAEKMPVVHFNGRSASAKVM